MSDEADEISGWEKRRAGMSRRIEVETLQLCLERGIGAVTIDDIAQRSGISRRTFYRYFTTIDDVLTASPRRSLERISRGVRERPAAEGIREALVKGGYKWGPSAEERELQILASQLAQTQPREWFQAIDRMQPSGREVYETLTAERLATSGKDVALAPLISEVIRAVIRHVAITHRENGKFASQPEHLDEALAALADILIP